MTQEPHESDSVAQPAPPAAPASPPFDEQEQEAIAREDRIAGELIGVSLTLFFVYTIVTGIGIAWWIGVATG